MLGESTRHAGDLDLTVEKPLMDLEVLDPLSATDFLGLLHKVQQAAFKQGSRAAYRRMSDAICSLNSGAI
jgi:hypothetical protein